MLLRRVINGSLLFVLFACLVSGGRTLIGAHASSSSLGIPLATQDASQQQPSASPKPTPKEEEILSTDDILRTETNLTNIFFSAEDRNKRYIATLKQEDIRVLEDGQPQQIFTFQQNTDLPLSLAILIDTSRSEERTLPDEKAAARDFLETVLRANKDEAAVVSFTGEVTLEQGFTGSLDRLRRAIDRVEFVPPSGYIGGGIVVPTTPPISGSNQVLAGSTAIWDAVWATSKELLADSAEHTRRAIILLTDGDDTISQVKMQEAIEQAEKADALIYSIGIGDRYSFGVNEGALRKISDKTGGRAYFPHNERELKDAFAEIQRDLRERYLVAYSPGIRHAMARIAKSDRSVRPDLQKELKLNYRQGYFAKAPESNSPRPPATKRS